MSDQFTEQQVKTYFKFKGNYCPECGSLDIEGRAFNADSLSAWQDITCNQCDTEWRDLYTLTGVDKL